MRKENRYMQERGRRWHYVRRVPVDVAKHYDEAIIRRSLDTDDMGTARLRRDATEKADDDYWTELRMEGQTTPVAVRRYETAISLAKAMRFDYIPSDKFAMPENIEELSGNQNFDTALFEFLGITIGNAIIGDEGMDQLQRSEASEG